MCALRRVNDKDAGPDALGILLPPGRRTFVILRPRALPWDLLLTRSDGNGDTGTSFREVSRDEGVKVAEAVLCGLEASTGRVEVVGQFVRATVGEFRFIACSRQPGQPYRAHAFARSEEAESTALAVAGVLFSGAREQQVYLNTHNFAR